jgi:type I restriction enzyme S subunit
MSTAVTPRYINFSELDRWDVKYFSGRIKSKYPLVSLSTFVREHNEKVRPFNFPDDTFKILGVNNTDGIFHAYDALGKEIKQPYKKVAAGDFAYNPYRINVGSIGWVPDEHEGAFISPAYVVFSIDENIILPELFWFILKSEFFNKTLRAATAGSVRMNLTYPLLETLKVPLPPLPIQQRIVAYREKTQQSILKSNEQIKLIENNIQAQFLSELALPVPKKTTPPKCFSTNWEMFDRWSVSYNQAIMSMIDLRKGQYPVVELGSILELVQYGTSDKANITKNGTPVLRMNNIKDGVLDYTDLKHIKLSSKVRKSLLLKDGDILFNRTNSKELVGKCAVFHSDDEYVFASYLIRVKVNPTKADPDFVVYTLNAVIGRQQIDAISRQIIGQANINSQELRSLNIPLPPLKVQQSIMKRVESGCAKIQQIKEDSEQLEKETSSNIEKLILGTLSVEDL